MGQALSSFIRCVCGESEEEESPIEQKLLISPPISDSCSSIIQVVKNKQVSPPFPDLKAREPRVEDQENEEEKLITSEGVGMKERWIQHYSSSHSFQLVEDNWQVSPPFPVLNTKEPREEDQAKEEERPNVQNLLISPPISDSCSSTIQVVKNKQVSPPFPDLNAREPRVEDQENEEEKLITSEEVGMKERWIQHYSSSHSFQLVEDNWQVSPPFPVLNTKEPREEDQAKEEERPNVQNLLISPPISDSCSSTIQVVKNKQVSPPFPDLNAREPRVEDQENEEEKLITSEEVGMKERWIQHYSSSHSFQLVEDNWQVSPPFPVLNTKEPREEDQAKEEERPNVQNLLISPPISDSCSSTIQVVKNEQVSPPFPDLNAREPRVEDQENEEEKLIPSEEVGMKERWIQHYSISHSIQLVEDNWQVSPTFPVLNTKEPREEDQAKEEERPIEQNLLISPPISDSCSSTIQVVKNKQVSPPFPDLNAREPRVEDQENEEEKLITSKEVGMKERWLQHYSSSHSIQPVEDNWQVSPPFPILNAKEPREEDQAKEEDNEAEKLVISEEVARKETWIQHYISFDCIQLVEDNEEVKLIMSKEVVMKERWIQHYCSSHKMLLVGEGDFSFSASLAVAFGSATNMVATSLNSTGYLRKNYRKAMSNIDKLRSRGCTVMHGVNATKMANHGFLKGMTFDRIIYNFPHAGFISGESTKSQLRRQQTLVRLFLENAKKMISEEGEIHIAHKSWGFFRRWNLEHLASNVGLRLIEELPFNFRDYEGYRTKYGFGGDKNFNCNPSKTYKFGLRAWDMNF